MHFEVEVYQIHVEACKDHDYCHVKMPTEEKKSKSCVDGSKSMRASFVIYADTECILEPIQGCDRDPKSPFTRNVNRHVGSGAASLIVFAHGEWEKPMDLHCGKTSIKDWCKSLKNQVIRAIKTKPKAMELLTPEQRKLHKEAGKCFIFNKLFKKEEDFKMRKVKDHCHYTANIVVQHILFVTCNTRYQILYR